MSDFDDPKYASYVQLCRELKLKREFEEGDRYWWEPSDRDRALGARGGVSMYYGNLDRDDTKSADERHAWLPTLADWVEMLKAIGARQITIEYLPESPEDPEEVSVSTKGTVGLGPTEEEASAHLWLKVK